MIVLDASVLIAYLDAEDDHHSRAEELLVQEIDDDFAANSLTLAEVLVAPAREGGRLDAVRKALADLEVRELPFPAGAAVKLARLRATTSLMMPDCCVLLAAEEEQARVASFDHRLLDAASDRRIVTVSD